MVINRNILFLLALFLSTSFLYSAQSGSIRGVVYDKDFEAPLFEAKVTIAETNQAVLTTSEGNYLLPEIPVGTYTLVFSKSGYIRQVKSDIIVSPSQLTEVDTWLEGDYTDMEEFVVQDIQLGGGSEAALLELRFDAPALMDSIGAELMSQAGVSDAAGALKLVAGATVQDGKYAVVRGLPDRYVNSQMNGIRLPTADSDKRAVQLDQFPAAVIESVQVSKTFTPDQQGDASGGAVNIVLKSVPEETSFNFNLGIGYNANVAGSDKFLSSKGGGVGTWGKKDINWPSTGDGDAVGATEASTPFDYKWSVSGGGKHVLNDEVTVGAFGSFYYEKDSSYYDDGIDDSLWVESPGARATPQRQQQTASDEFYTSLYDVTKSSQEVKWGALGVLGLETESHSISFMNLYTHAAQDTTVVAENTRGKHYYFPDYNPDNPYTDGNQKDNAGLSPYVRNQTLEYTERTTHTMQFSGRHSLLETDFEKEIGSLMTFLRPEVDWGYAISSSSMYQPDKRQYGSEWTGPYYSVNYSDQSLIYNEAEYGGYKPAQNINIGNLQRVWKDITEESNQYYANLKLPFKQWSDSEGYFKFGIFNDSVEREYYQDSFSNPGAGNISYEGSWQDYWTDVYPSGNYSITGSDIDVDYFGEQDISAYYYMVDLPLNEQINIIGGARYERTELSIVNVPEDSVTWINNGVLSALNPGDADVNYEQDDILPSIGFVYAPNEKWTFRTSYSETIARQTFKELTPIMQQEYLGADVFIGNPELQMSSLKNYDVRLDYTLFKDGLLSMSYFHKKIKDPIEYVQGVADFIYTYPTNYPEGKIDGIEFEYRQKLGQIWRTMDGFSVGTNATFIKSEVTLPESEAAIFNSPNIQAPMKERDMSHTPEFLYNIYSTYDFPDNATRCGLFYTVRGDTLVAGATQSNGNFVPNVYEAEYGTLNFTFSHKFNETWKLGFKAKNLLNPKIQKIYRHHISDDEYVKTSYTKGMDFSLSLSATF